MGKFVCDGRCVVDRRTSEEEEGKAKICLNRGADLISSRFRSSSLYINDLMFSIQVTLPLGARRNRLYLE